MKSRRLGYHDTFVPALLFLLRDLNFSKRCHNPLPDRLDMSSFGCRLEETLVYTLSPSVASSMTERRCARRWCLSTRTRAYHTLLHLGELSRVQQDLWRRVPHPQSPRPYCVTYGFCGRVNSQLCLKGASRHDYQEVLYWLNGSDMDGLRWKTYRHLSPYGA